MDRRVVDGKRWVSLAADIDGKDYDAQKVARDLEVLSAEHRVTGWSDKGNGPFFILTSWLIFWMDKERVAFPEK